MSRVELEDGQTYSPTLSNLGLRTIGYQFAESDQYDPAWCGDVSRFCEKRERIKTLADRVAVSVFAHIFETPVGFGPEHKDEAEPFARMILDDASWEDKLAEMVSWYLPVGRRELFNSVKAEDQHRYEILQQQTCGVDPYDEPVDEMGYETISVDLEPHGAQTLLGSKHPTDPSLPKFGIDLGRQMNEVYTECGSFQPGYDDDQIVEYPVELLDTLYDSGYQPDLILVSNRVQDSFNTPSELIIADTDQFGYRVVNKEWGVDTLTGMDIRPTGRLPDPNKTLQFRMKSRQGVAVMNDDAAIRGLCRP